MISALKHISCRLCASRAEPVGSLASSFQDRQYHYYSCPSCSFYFIADPWLDYKKIYTENYYRGKQGDASVDYYDEIDAPGQNIRKFEYKGLLKVAKHLLKLETFTWLDYGCGNGGLLPYVQKNSQIKIEGYDEGAITSYARSKGINILSAADLKKRRGRYDFITAVEVLEHCVSPLQQLGEIKKLLKPGGIFFLTTGNVYPHRHNLFAWSYACAPDVHISFFQPKSLNFAFKKAGLVPLKAAYLPGSTEIIQYKILKAFRVKRDGFWIRCLPWFLLSRLADLREQVTKQPMAMRERLPQKIRHRGTV